MENLDPASLDTHQSIVSEIFNSAAVEEKSLSLGLLLKAYDVVIAKHGINATELLGIQIYRSLLHWGRQHVTEPRSRVPLEPLDLEPLCHSQHPTHSLGGTLVVPASFETLPRKIEVPEMSEPRTLPANEAMEAMQKDLVSLSLPQTSRLVEIDANTIARSSVDTQRLRVQSTSAILAEAFAYRKILARALASWATASKLLVDLTSVHQRQALHFWHRRAKLKPRYKVARESMKTRIEGHFKQILREWQGYIQSKRTLDQTLMGFRRQKTSRIQQQLLGDWSDYVRNLKEQLCKLKVQHELESMKTCWTAMRRYSEQKQLMKLYRSWADVHWRRTRFTAAWQAWLAWHRKRLGISPFIIFHIWHCLAMFDFVLSTPPLLCLQRN